MKAKIIYLLSLTFLFCMLMTSKTYANVPTLIYPVDNVFTEGIYVLNSPNSKEYNLQFDFLNSKSNTSIIILDEKFDIMYQNSNCNGRCNAGIVTNKNTIILITKDEIALSFIKQK